MEGQLGLTRGTWVAVSPAEARGCPLQAIWPGSTAWHSKQILHEWCKVTQKARLKKARFKVSESKALKGPRKQGLKGLKKARLLKILGGSRCPRIRTQQGLALSDYRPLGWEATRGTSLGAGSRCGCLSVCSGLPAGRIRGHEIMMRPRRGN